ncbi:porin [Aureimonas sp. Leaf427]
MRIIATDSAGNADIDLDNLNSPAGANGVYTTTSGTRTVTSANATLPADAGGVTIPGYFTRGLSNDDYNVVSRTRARLEFDARESTELGMLRSFARLQATNTSAANNGVDMDQAYLQLGGLTVGKLDSLWAERDGLFTSNDWSLYDRSNNRISYTFAAAGFTAAISLEDDGSGDFVPDVVGQLAYKGGWGEAYISGVYDEQASDAPNIRRFNTSASTATNVAIPSYSNFFIYDNPATAAFDPSLEAFYNGDLNDADDGAFALKGGVTLKDLIATGSQFKIEGSYAFDPTVYSSDAGGNYIAPGGNIRAGGIFQAQTAGVNVGAPIIIDSLSGQAYRLSSEFQIGAGYQQKFGKLFTAVSGVYGQTFDLKRSVQSFDAAGVANGVSTQNIGAAEYWGAAVNVGYNLTTNFSVLGEVSYREIDLPSPIVNDFDATAGFIEFKRTF